MSQNYKMIIQYEGTRYDGWQKQGNTENTIQGKLEKVLARMTGFPVEVHGSGRTDAGVHAMGQVANFHLPDGWKPEGSQNQNGGQNQEKNQKNDWHKNGAHDRKQFAVADP